MKNPGFIVFEGIDSAGKSTQVNMLDKALSKQGFNVVLTRDPGGTEVGEGLRDILLWSSQIIDPKTEAFLYAGARSQLVAEVITPALRAGKIVISDRFSDSTFAYQGAGRGMDFEFLELININACQGVVPDLTVLLDIDPEKSKVRRDRPEDRMEKEGHEFLKRVRHGYLARADKNRQGYLILDGSLSRDKIFELILENVQEHLFSERINP
ncbi:MAG: dTMP kinase [Peptococcaceae bacterium]|nr:dTMP kinase [Peptococcaceae bacterium]